MAATLPAALAARPAMPRVRHARPPAAAAARRALGRRAVLGCWRTARAWLTLALLAGIIVSLVIGAAPAIQRVRPGVPLDRASGTRCRTYGGAGDDLRHADHLADRAADRGAGELRHRAVPDRAVARLAASARSAPRSNCWRRCPRSSTACGACSCSARSCRDLRAAAAADGASAACPCSARCSPARRSASACCRPASSWRSWSSRSSPR